MNEMRLKNLFLNGIRKRQFLQSVYSCSVRRKPVLFVVKNASVCGISASQQRQYQLPQEVHNDCYSRSFHSICRKSRQNRSILGGDAYSWKHFCKNYVNFAIAKRVVEASPSPVQPYLRLMRVDKPIGTWLLYWPCTWSLALAAPPGTLPDLYLLCLFGVGAFLMRGAGCVINDLWDQDFDKKVERTRSRPLAAAELTPFQGLCLLGGLLSTSLCVLLQLNWYSVFVGASSLALVVAYPVAKRFTYWPQVVLGLTFNWGCLLGWAAVQGHISWLPVLGLYSAGICWTLVYDTIYAHQDKADDLLVGVKSTALKFGSDTRLYLSGFGLGTVAGLATAGLLCHQTWPFYCSLLATAAHLAWQVGTVDIDSPSDCWEKFRSNQWLGLLLFLGICSGNLLRTDHSTAQQKLVQCDDDDES